MSEEFDVIIAYTRTQAIADGVLVDVTETAKEAGLEYPVALTRAVWCKYVEVPEGVEGQDEAGRLWDILVLLRHAIRQTGTGARKEIRYCLHVRNTNQEGESPLVKLKAVCGYADDGGPCITVMNPDED
jgi:hypothetical protein